MWHYMRLKRRIDVRVFNQKSAKQNSIITINRLLKYEGQPYDPYSLFLWLNKKGLVRQLRRCQKLLNQMLKKLGFSSWRGPVKIVIGCFIMAFTLVNVHMQADITEGGILGFTLFSYRIFNINPAILGVVLDFICFALGFSMFGKKFIWKTAIASTTFAIFYKTFISLGPILPSIYDKPFLSALVGGLGIGFGCGLVLTEGGAAGGDDALAMVMSKKFKIEISKAYIIADFVVLALSLAYIPAIRLLFSFLTTTVSSLVLGRFEKLANLSAPKLAKPSLTRKEGLLN